MVRGRDKGQFCAPIPRRAMSARPVCGSRWMLSLSLILSVVLALQGAPTAGRRNMPKPGERPAIEDPSQLEKRAGGAGVPLLPPGEELGSAALGTGEGADLSDYGDERVSGEDHISGFGIDWISGDDSIDYTDFHFPVSVKKPEIPEDEGQGEAE